MSTVTKSRFFATAFPIILANIAVPIIGLVDTAVIGQLDSAILLAAVGMGAAFLTGIYHLFNFLTTGISAFTSQARGKSDGDEVLIIGLRGMLLGLLIGFSIFIIHKPIFYGIFLISPADPAVNEAAMNYISIRVFAAPFALANFAFMGWLLAMERNSLVVIIQLIVTASNIILDLLFVLNLDLGISGVAAASAISETIGFIVGLIFCRKIIKKELILNTKVLFHFSSWARILRVNSDIFIRTLLLECVAVSYIVIGSMLGTLSQAANQILYQFLSLSSYALDGFAFSSQVFIGISVGKRDVSGLRRASEMGLKYGLCGGLIITTLFLVLGDELINLMTVSASVREEANRFLFLVAITPLTGVASWIFDGIFLGALETKKLRRAMLESVIFYFVIISLTVPIIGNYGLWISVSGLFICRALTLMVRYKSLENSLIE